MAALFQLSPGRSCGVRADDGLTEATRFLALLGLHTGGRGRIFPTVPARWAASSSAIVEPRRGSISRCGTRCSAARPAQARPPQTPGGLGREGSSPAPLPASQRGWHLSGGSAACGDPGAGRWAALAAAGQAGRRWRRLRSQAGRHRGGGTGLRSWGVSCVPAQSPRRGRGPRRRRRRSRSTLGATSHEQRRRGR